MILLQFISKIVLPLFSSKSFIASDAIVAVHGRSCSMWDLPRPGIEPVSLAGGFFTTESPGKPLQMY